MLQNDILLKHLSTVMDPELGVNIVDLGMVKDITYTNSEVTIDLALTIAECPMRNQIETEIKRKLKLIENIKEVFINVVAMSKEDRSSLMTIARKNARDKAIPTNINSRTRVVAVGSGKGGVGKSTISTNLAVGLESLGFTTGLLDADIWGCSIPQMLGLSGRLEGNEETRRIKPIEKQAGSGVLKIVSMGFLITEESSSLNWRGLILNRAVRHFLEDVEWGHLDYLIIDMPPGTGDVQMGLAKMLPRSDMIVVTTPSKTVQNVAARVANMARSYYLRIAGVIENMSYFVNETDEKYFIFGRGGGQELARELGVPLLGSVPIDENVSKGSDEGNPVILSDGQASLALNTIVDVIINEAIPLNKITDCSAYIEQETAVQLNK